MVVLSKHNRAAEELVAVADAPVSDGRVTITELVNGVEDVDEAILLVLVSAWDKSGFYYRKAGP